MTHDSDLDEADFDELPVELGIPDRSLHEYDRLDPFISRLGGEPTWLCEAPDSTEMLCTVCFSKMFLLVQFDCSDANCHEDRVLYLFACNTKKCVYTDPNRAFKAVIQRCPAKPEIVSNTSRPSANFWDSAEPAQPVAADVHNNHEGKSEFVDCKSHGKSCFPVMVLRIVDELIRNAVKRREPVPTQIQTEESDSDEEASVNEDLTMDAFIERTAHYPRQCLRYSPEGLPLHFSQRHQDTYKVLHCEKCRVEMKFLAQLMPAFLSVVKVDDHVDHIAKADRDKYKPFGDGLEFATVIVCWCEKCGTADTFVEQEVY
jgi:hypothetical protein